MHPLTETEFKNKKKIKKFSKNKNISNKKNLTEKDFLKKIKDKKIKQVKNNSLNKIKPEIVKGKVFKIDKENCYVRFNNRVGICIWKNITDFPERVLDIIKLNGVYNFLILGIINKTIIITKSIKVDFYWNLSYKTVHPNEIKNKSRCIPTASHFRNLHNHLNKILNNEHYLKKHNFYNKNNNKKNLIKFDLILKNQKPK